MQKYLNTIGVNVEKSTDQQARQDQIKNSEGAFVWGVDAWGRLERFLILGSEGGSYYANERDLTNQNVTAIAETIDEDYKRAIDTIVSISKSGRAPSNDPAIFALALASSSTNVSARRYALQHVKDVCRIGTHLFTFVQYTRNMRGWGRALRRAVSNWYLDMTPGRLAYQIVKYRQRNGWSHRDLLRLSHPAAQDEAHQFLLKWIAKPASIQENPPNEWGQFIGAFEEAAHEEDVGKLVNLITDYSLPREAIPTPMLRKQEVWAALLPSMPATALIRNLGNMTRNGLLTPTSEGTQIAVAKLSDRNWLKKSRIHPVSVLNALTIYRLGRRLRGQGRFGGHIQASYSQGNDWVPVPAIIEQLNDSFHKSFELIEPTNKRLLLALDVSSSMTFRFITGTALSPSRATAAMALATAKTEPFYNMVAFKHNIAPIDITGNMRLQDAISRVEDVQFGGTDCALPMLYAIEKSLEVDAFVVYTDSETQVIRSSMHPFQALKRYRRESGIDAKLIVVAMLSNGFRISDPTDSGMLDVVGFDTATPALISDFISGKI